MKLSLNWLREYVKIEETPEVLADTISASLAEVEDIQTINTTFDGLIIGKIKEITQHPNADKLQLTKVDIGKQTLSIVCGAHNISVGDLVPVIQEGYTLPGNDMSIEARDVRGKISHGMLCSPKELGISQDHSGIYLLNNEKDAKVGKRFDSLFEIDDVLIEIENKALTHRPDAFSHLGMAREIAAMFNTHFTVNTDKETLTQDDTYTLNIAIEDQILCRRYSGVIVPNITIMSSPLWMLMRLQRIGVRTTNNIVDITNYVMHDIGQPLHAFDREKLNGDTIIVRTATPQEQIVTLDGITRELTQDMLVIADEMKPVALAGIMGGAATEISDATKDIILESANFEQYSNRRTSRTLGLQTEATIRFGKNQDPSNTLPALLKTLALLKKYANATTRSAIIDVTHEHTFDSRGERIIPFSVSFIQEKIGAQTPIAEKTISNIFKALGVEIIKHDAKLGAKPPTYRPDLQTAEDLVEEIARMIGYDNITPTLPLRDLTPATHNQHVLWLRKVREQAARLGLTETYSFSFVGKELYEKCTVADLLDIAIANPVSPEYAYIKPLLLPQLIDSIVRNSKHTKTASLFEIDTVHTKNGVEVPTSTHLLGISILNAEYYMIKGLVESLFHHLRIAQVRFDLPDESPKNALFDKQRSASVWIGNMLIGHIGELHPKVQTSFEISQSIGIAELDLDALFANKDTSTLYLPIAVHPAITADISIKLPKTFSLDKVIEHIKQTNTPFLKTIDVINVMSTGDKVQKDEKIVTFRLAFQDQVKSLSKSDIQPHVQSIAGLVIQ